MYWCLCILMDPLTHTNTGTHPQLSVELLLQPASLVPPPLTEAVPLHLYQECMVPQPEDQEGATEQEGEVSGQWIFITSCMRCYNYPMRMCSKGLSKHVCLSLCGQKRLKQLKYAVIHAKKGTITTFELFFEGHSTDTRKRDIRYLGAANPIISYYSSPAPPL